MSNFAGWMSARGHSVAIVANYDQQRLLKSLGTTDCKVLDFKTLKPVATGVSAASPGRTSSVSRAGRVAASLARRIARWQSSSGSLAIVLLAIYWALQILRFRWLWRREVARLNCDVAFVWWDNAATSNGELLNLLKGCGALLVHLPVALSDQKIIARLRADSEVMQIGPRSGLVSRALAHFYPDQVLNFEFRMLFYYHPAEILAMALLGALPAKPWVLGASRADIVCFADINQCDYWVKHGLDAGRARIVGNFDLQDVALDIARLCRSHPCLFEQTTPLVLINMPNLVEHNVMSDWDLFWTHVHKMFVPFDDYKVEMVVNLHPKSDPVNYAWLADAYGCLVTQSDIGAWISLADLYVSLCSSTETIASDFGVPVLDIGLIFGFESDVLKSLPNITFLDSYQDYETAARSQLADFTEQPRRYHALEDSTSLISPFHKVNSLVDMKIATSC